MPENNNGRKPHLNKIALFNHLMDRDDIPDEELRLLLKLLRTRNEYTGYCCPSQRTLADYMKMNQPKIGRLLNRLRQKKIIVSTWNYDAISCRRGACQYFFVHDLHDLDRIDLDPTISEHLAAVKEKLKPSANLRTKKRKK